MALFYDNWPDNSAAVSTAPPRHFQRRDRSVTDTSSTYRMGPLQFLENGQRLILKNLVPFGSQDTVTVLLCAAHIF